MTADEGDSHAGADGGPVRHIPVLLPEVMSALAPERGHRVLDGTFGAGGYSRAILGTGAHVIAIDRDPNAIRDGQDLVASSSGRLTLVQDRFSALLDHTEEGGLDGIVLDIGVSSMQIDEAERGFSFQREGPLDMRMAQSGVSAADVVNRMKATDLARVFGLLGEEKNAGRIARAIEAERKGKPFATTRDLARLIEKITPRRHDDRIHPATRVFQALRTYVNDELGELARALFSAERALKPGGRLVVVTFHSLEDRIVKRYFSDRSGRASGSRHLPEVSARGAIFDTPGRQPVVAGEAECEANPRARSAKLRFGIRTAEPARAADLSILPVPTLAALAAIGG